jgi:tetratricopeptide (TPR) repeat protein
MIAAAAALVLSLSALGPAQAKASSTRGTSAAPKAVNFNQLAREASQARDENRDDEAIRLYKQCLKIKPSWNEGLWYLSTLLYEKEKYSETRDLLRQFVSYDPEAGPGWALLGMSEFQTREYSRALDHLRRARSLGLGDRKEMAQSVAYFAAASLSRLEQFDDAMDLLFELVNLGRCDIPIQEAAGLAALRMPFIPAEIPPDRSEMVQTAGAAFCAVQMGQRDDAEKKFRTLVETYPKEPGVHYLFGTFLTDSLTEKAIHELTLELEISPFNVLARLRLADIYLKQQQPEQAQPFAQDALEIEPGEASTHMVYGEVLAAERDFPGAIRELEKAEQIAPQVVRTRFDLLRAYAAAGRTEDANREKEAIEKLRQPAAAQKPM